ncbi:methyltransferase domain-containing protein [Marisediminicola senii]|uniref:class I SAM-dependent methyltransferase n=1 Tax=Marisediminicola senii TaxID=2711233 RepID=UPI0013EC4EC4|nr:class I SAM-dependent methyltransferase [Marisediminicola senii]
MPIGSVTRGTTGTNRLRRVDRWIAQHPAFLAQSEPLVVDLGFGASATTPLELHSRLARHRPATSVVGIEIDPARVAVARLSERAGVSFRLGGFEVPLDGGRGATVIRAFNVLRQYDEAVVVEQWRRMTRRLAPGGILVEGTCDEIGRVSSWVEVTPAGPVSLTISLRLTDLVAPSIVAERLPKVLIHRNVTGEGVHRLMGDLDRHWQRNAPLSTYGPRQRWIATVRGLVADGWPVLGTAARWRLGELTVAWTAVAPLGFGWGD